MMDMSKDSEGWRWMGRGARACAVAAVLVVGCSDGDTPVAGLRRAEDVTCPPGKTPTEPQNGPRCVFTLSSASGVAGSVTWAPYWIVDGQESPTPGGFSQYAPDPPPPAGYRCRGQCTCTLTAENGTICASLPASEPIPANLYCPPALPPPQTVTGPSIMNLEGPDPVPEADQDTCLNLWAEANRDQECEPACTAHATERTQQTVAPLVCCVDGNDGGADGGSGGDGDVCDGDAADDGGGDDATPAEDLTSPAEDLTSPPEDLAQPSED